MKCSWAEFERTQGNSSVSESRSRNARQQREEREEPPDTYLHLQLNDSVAVATLKRMLCKQPQMVSQDRNRIQNTESSALCNLSSKITGFPT